MDTKISMLMNVAQKVDVGGGGAGLPASSASVVLSKGRLPGCAKVVFVS